MPVVGQVAHKCFYFSACKNCNTRAGMIVTSQVDYIYVFFDFPLVKILMQGQQF